jgi:hypothetical protein
MALHDMAKMTVTGTPGTGTITLNSAASGFQTFAASGVVDQERVSYSIVDGTNWEVGHGTYTAATTKLTRGPIFSSNSNAAISATSAATVFIPVLAEDLAPQSYIASSDPGASNDKTQGYVAGSIGVNTGTGRAFICRNNQTGAAVWEVLGPGYHPGFVANNWYSFPPGVDTNLVGTTAPVAGTTYLFPIFVPERMTIAAIAEKITTSSGNIAFGLFSNNSGATPAVNRPGNKLANTASTASSVAIVQASLSASQQIEAGWYWPAFQTDNTTIRYVVRGTSDLITRMFLGSATIANVAGTTAQIQGVSFPGTFGTWPGDISGQTFTEVTTGVMPDMVLQPSSIP